MPTTSNYWRQNNTSRNEWKKRKTCIVNKWGLSFRLYYKTHITILIYYRGKKVLKNAVKQPEQTTTSFRISTSVYYEQNFDVPFFNYINELQTTATTSRMVVVHRFDCTGGPRYSQFWLFVDLKTINNEGKLLFLTSFRLKTEDLVFAVEGT